MVFSATKMFTNGSCYRTGAPFFPGEDLLHKCELCSILAPSLTSAIDALDNGVGTALAQTREVVSEQLQGENLAKLSDSHWGP